MLYPNLESDLQLIKKNTKKAKKNKNHSFFLLKSDQTKYPKSKKILNSYSKASNYQEKMVEEKKSYSEKNLGPKIPNKSTFSPKI
jgi:hypothetical protein